jgi:hypothetical protein
MSSAANANAAVGSQTTFTTAACAATPLMS